MNTGKECLKCGYVREEADPKPNYLCPNCGAVYAKVEAHLSASETAPKISKFKKVCRALEAAKAEPELEKIRARQSTSTIIRSYNAKQNVAITIYEKEAAKLALEGFEPVNQIWEDGQWGCLAFLVALFLCFGFIGIPILLYLIIVKPAGTLTVTYKRVAPPKDTTEVSATYPI